MVETDGDKEVNGPDKDNSEEIRPCLACSNDLNDEATYGKFLIGCDVCFGWFHLKCTKVSKKAYDMIVANNSLHWFCNSCNDKSKNLLGQLELLIAEQKTLRSELNSVKAKLNERPPTENLKTEISNFFKDTSNPDFPPLLHANAPKEQITQFIDTHVKPIITNEVSPLVSADMEEQRQIEKIKLNLVVSGIPESENSDEDLNKVKDIIINELNITPQIEKAERCGKIRKSNDGSPQKPRLIRLYMKDVKNRKEILRKAPNLRNAQDEDVQDNVYIRPDQMLKQQLESKNLRDQLRRLKQQQPETTHKIVKGKIVSNPAQDI